MKTHTASAALSGLFAACALTHAAGQSPLTTAELNQPATWPLWAQPRQNTLADGKPWQVFPDSRLGTENMRRNVGRLRFVISRFDKSADRPFLILQLARHLTDLDEDRLAWQTLDFLMKLPGDTPHNARIWLKPTLQSVKDDGRCDQARILARNGLAEAALKTMEQIPHSGGYKAVLEAEIHMLLGDNDKALALLPQAHGGGHEEKGFSDVFLRMRAASMAAAMGRHDLVAGIASPVLSQPMSAQKWPQWQSAWSILKNLDDNAGTGPLPPPAGLKNGIFTGTCRGFITELDASVRLAGGRIVSVKITRQKEDRPWSALDVIPERIVRRQSLKVDAVTGATISSCAVITAVENALRKAAK